jgi:hypothetical protein
MNHIKIKNRNKSQRNRNYSLKGGNLKDKKILSILIAANTTKHPRWLKELTNNTVQQFLWGV